MERTPLGDTGLELPRLIFGCWGLTSDFQWKDRQEKDSLEAIDAAIESGANFFDTAEMYAEGASETLLGRAIAGRRDRVLIASKVGPENMRPEQVIAACESSLRRLGTDHLDLYQTHWFADREVPVLETWGAMRELRSRGLVRAIGVCNAGTGDLETLATVESPVTNQLPYNLLWRQIEEATLPACRERSIATIVYSPLLHGLLAGLYETASDVPDGRARSRHFSTDRSLARHGESGQEEATFATIARISKIAAGADRPLADVALGWLASRPDVAGIIAGARTRAQLERNVRGLETPLSADVIRALDAATEDLRQALGSNPDLWQGEKGSRFH